MHIYRFHIHIEYTHTCFRQLMSSNNTVNRYSFRSSKKRLQYGSTLGAWAASSSEIIWTQKVFKLRSSAPTNTYGCVLLQSISHDSRAIGPADITSHIGSHAKLSPTYRGWSLRHGGVHALWIGDNCRLRPLRFRHTRALMTRATHHSGIMLHLFAGISFLAILSSAQIINWS